MKRAVVGLCFTLAAASALRAQTPAPAATGTPRFEVASVKPSDPNPSSPLGAIPMVRPPVGGRFTATNLPLRLLVRMVYSVQDFQIDGGPSWQMTQKFDITAKAEDSFAGGMQDVLPMVKTLLAERFKLKTHTETREMPLYALVIARNDGTLGPALKPSKDDCSNREAEAQKLADALAKGGPAAVASLMPKPGEARPCSMAPMMGAGGFGMKASGQPMAIIVQLLTQATGRVVQDKTGLTGLYDWEMAFDPEVLLRVASQVGVTLPAGVTLPPSDNPSLMTALREQLGLKLESTKGPVEILVIDSAEMPTPD